MIMALNKLATKLRKTSTLIHFFSLTTFRPILHSHPFSHFLPTHKRLLSPSTSLPKPSLSPNQTLFEITPVELQLQKTINPSEPGINGVLEILRKAKTFASQREGIAFLDESGVNPTEGLVCSVIWVLRNDWDLALLGFKWGEKWGEKWGCCNSGSGAWDLMVWVLGKHKRFGSAWHLVRMMIGAKVDPQQAMLIMIESYAIANNPGKAIQTFQAMNKFRSQDSRAFHTLLHALCKNGNVEEAEEFMLLSKEFFPLTSESFNIILDGWCNITLDVFEAKRIWREMSKYCITPDATSYAHIISCFSKVGNLSDSLRFYSEMKKNWSPCLKVYNSLIYVLAWEKCVREALNLLEKIKSMGLQPDTSTYNAIIVPLCDAKNLEQARHLFDDMVRKGLVPTTEIFHAFIGSEESVEGTLELMKKMSEAGSGPSGHTFLLILDKFIKLEQPQNTLTMWMKMRDYKVVPDSAHYTVLVKGMVTCGWLAMARRLHDEIKLKTLLNDPILEKFLDAPKGGDGKKQRTPIKNDVKAPLEKVVKREGKHGYQ